ncbi:hypothetical protein EIP91_005418 [Steccherinum ochraceum]|uniref:CFEM domain-containing protein n=1 Tax=Steccherinum ochraceum TaxID=92696 RepID=A0A4R0RFH6_9APHY|nr:hypothetical protein EIP91_005418 [Steccherinum ochraceum]
MRATTVFVALAAAASVSAGNIFRRQYPDCATPCIQNAQTGNCFSDDLNCLCKSQDFISSTTSCIIASCSASDAVKAEAVAQGFCETVGVTLTSQPSNQPTGAPSNTDSNTAASNTNTAASSSSSPSPTSSSATPSDTAAAAPSPPAQQQGSGAMRTSHGVNAVLALGVVGAGALLL